VSGLGSRGSSLAASAAVAPSPLCFVAAARRWRQDQQAPPGRGPGDAGPNHAAPFGFVSARASLPEAGQTMRYGGRGLADEVRGFRSSVSVPGVARATLRLSSTTMMADRCGGEGAARADRTGSRRPVDRAGGRAVTQDSAWMPGRTRGASMKFSSRFARRQREAKAPGFRF